MCEGESILLTATGSATNYTWSGGITNGVSFTPSTTNTYTVTATGANSCTASQTINVVVSPPPMVSATKDYDINCSHTSCQLHGAGAMQYQWLPTTGHTNANIANPIATPSLTTNYMLVGNNGNCFDTAYVEVKVEDLALANIYIPNAFTPNQDGLNDYIKVISNSTNFSNFYFAIYNRWGQRVFETDNIALGWEGHLYGKDAPSGTYYYFLRAETPCGKIFKKGDIILLR
ncbi:MAG: gliding motility-associated C-terminal domain-containing protein [Chitinophagaceae bacterium]